MYNTLLPGLVDLYAQYGGSIYPPRWIYMPTTLHLYAHRHSLF